jgi:predicted deacylase
MTVPKSIPRVLADYHTGPGPTLVVVASLHGNEPAGYHASRRIIQRLQETPVELKGRLSFVTGNRAALETGQRYIQLDLNRLWSSANLSKIRNGEVGEGDPAGLREAADLLPTVEQLRGDGRNYVLDLHTTSGEAPPFTVLADSLANRKFGRALNLPVILGLEEQLDGTFLSVLESEGWTTCGCEGGQHDDPASIDHIEAVLWLAMAASGVLADPASLAEVKRSKSFLREVRAGLTRVFEVRYRHAITDFDRFVMRPGFASFSEVAAGQLVGDDGEGTVAIPESGRLLMPLYQAQGSDGFFLMRPVNRFWLVLSGIVRRLGAGSLAHLLPGVRRDPERQNALLIDQGTARWFALEVMHLLGFRRERVEGDILVVSRRPAELSR